MKNIILKNLEKCLIRGKFDEAEELLNKLYKDYIRDLVLSYAYNNENIIIYSFVLYMEKKTSDFFWIELAIELMLNPLCFVDGAYSFALYHSRKLLMLDDKIENLERLFFFSECPEIIIDKAELELIAMKILEKEPDNKKALGFLYERDL
ncbi:MAG: hypothetical protein IJ141_02945 [Lachnospiraceae bacterium]|nr:hypothetical protein [Lachnospiraceae bacterium]